MNWDYIAGFIDGEGSIVNTQNRVIISISNTHIGVLNEIKKFIGCGHISVYHYNPQKWKPSGAYKIGKHEEVLHVLENIEDRLIIKKKKAKDTIKFINSKKWFKPKEVNMNELLNLRYNKGHSFRKMGRILHINRQTLRNRMKKAGYNPEIKKLGS